jgi:hypothetical protein
VTRRDEFAGQFVEWWCLSLRLLGRLAYIHLGVQHLELPSAKPHAEHLAASAGSQRPHWSHPTATAWSAVPASRPQRRRLMPLEESGGGYLSSTL